MRQKKVKDTYLDKMDGKVSGGIKGWEQIQEPKAQTNEKVFFFFLVIHRKHSLTKWDHHSGKRQQKQNSGFVMKLSG